MTKNETPRVVELLPCPFCGGAASLSYYTRSASNEPAGHYVECDNCAAGGPTADVSSIVTDVRAEAITAWNTRTAAEAASREEVERLRIALSELVEAYVCNVDSCRVGGFYFDPEQEDVVVEARAALTASEGEDHG